MKMTTHEEMKDTLGFAIIQTGKILLRTINAMFASLTSEITFEQMGVLYIVSQSKNKEMIQQDIAEVSNKTKSAILKSIDILEKKGFVRRLSSVGDRRKNVIELTTAGKNIIKDMYDKFLEQDVTLKKGLTKEEMLLCLSVLLKVQQKCKESTSGSFPENSRKKAYHNSSAEFIK
jgi:MarR family transcriptional regulator for hemolysin